MNDISPYFRGIEVYNTALIVKVVFPSNWKCFQSEDERIKVTVGEEDPTMVYYYADSSNTTYEDLFDLIEETIKVNQDTILKLKLLKEKVEELRELFSNHTYDELQGITFSLETEKKPKRKYTKKKKEENTEKVEPVENNEKTEEE